MFVAVTYIDEWKVGAAVIIGLVLGQALSHLTGYFTSTEHRPVQEIAEASKTGPATNILSGLSSGLESAVYAVIAIAAAIGAALWLGNAEGLQFSLYLIALAGTGMLATTGIVVAEDTFGPVSDNAAGIAEMAGEFDGEPQRILVSLDAVGNTTKAVTKGFAIGSAVIAALALFASYIETIGEELNITAIGDELFQNPLTQINVADPKTFIGLLIGGSVGFLFSALTIRAVGRSAGVVVDEVRRQFREKPGIMNYTERPDYGSVIDICTAAALRELATPALLAVLTPAIIGFALGYQALGAFLVCAIATGALLANFLSNAGGAWDNGKKLIEDLPGGKGSDQHKAAVIGDTVGDPFKDTSGPALNPLIKVMNLVSLLLLPAIISLDDNTGARIAIVAVASIVLIGAVAFSKRPGNLVEDSGDSVNAIGGHANLGKVMAAEPAASAPPTSAAEHPELIFAIDKVMVDLRHDTELVERLRVVKQSLNKQ
jgi:K(+)-stimulated pyrophosphate-energized sodium pump